MKKTLVAYFSASGTTEKVAKTVAQAAQADLYEIRPEQTYTDADLDWNDKRSRSSVEMNDLSFRPAIANQVDGMDRYEVIYIGFPIWWYTAPTIVNTFLEQYDFSGKTVVPFATSGGTNLKKAAADLKKAYPDIHWKEGKLLNRFSESELKAWIDNVEG
jgi:flavodoxin